MPLIQCSNARIVADVVQRLGQREVNVVHLAARNAAGIGGQCFQRGQVGIGGGEFFRLSAIVVRFDVIGPQGQRLAKMGHCLVEPALLAQHVAQAQVRLDVAGVGGQGPAIARGRLVELALGLAKVGQVVVRFGKVGLQRRACR